MSTNLSKKNYSQFAYTSTRSQLSYHIPTDIRRQILMFGLLTIKLQFVINNNTKKNIELMQKNYAHR